MQAGHGIREPQIRSGSLSDGGKLGRKGFGGGGESWPQRLGLARRRGRRGRISVGRNLGPFSATCSKSGMVGGALFGHGGGSGGERRDAVEAYPIFIKKNGRGESFRHVGDNIEV